MKNKALRLVLLSLAFATSPLISCDPGPEGPGLYAPTKPVFTTDKWSTQKLVSGLNFPFEAIFFIDENTGFVGGDSGILKTIDGGKSWGKLNAALPTTHIYEMYFHDSNNGFVASTGGLLKTSDGGATWESTSFMDPVTSVLFTSPTTGFIGTSSDPGDLSSIKLYKTTDSGTNWNVVLSENNLDGARDLRFVNSTTGYARIGGHILKTIDSGDSWQHSFSNTDQSGHTYAISSLTISDRVIYAIFWLPSEDSFAGGIWKSEDGAAWKSMDQSPFTSIAFSTSGNLGFAAGPNNDPPIMYVSHNNGTTWESVKQPGYLPVAVAVPSDNVAYVLCRGGVLMKYLDK